MATNAPVPTERRGPETAARQGFRDSLRLLDRSASWFLWSSVLTVLLLPGAIALFSFPSLAAGLEASSGLTASQALLGLLLLAWAVNLCALFWHRHLKLVRKRLVEQAEAAEKHRVRADALYGLSIIDPLTGLYNRRFGETRLREEIARAEKSGEPLLVLAMDMNHFKEINDQYGHAAGDLALKTFARRLQRAIRACDVPIRVGGDEFLVILPECSQDKVQMILSRMEPLEISVEGKKVPVLFARGVSQYQVNDTPETIIHRADERLYAEKGRRPESVEAEPPIELQNY